MRILFIVRLAALAHLTVEIVRRISERVIHGSEAPNDALGVVTKKPKFIT